MVAPTVTNNTFVQLLVPLQILLLSLQSLLSIGTVIAVFALLSFNIAWFAVRINVWWLILHRDLRASVS